MQIDKSIGKPDVLQGYIFFEKKPIGDTHFCITSKQQSIFLMIEHQEVLHIHPVKKFQIYFLNGNGCIQIFGKTAGDLMDYESLKKAGLNQNPNNKDQHQNAQQDFERYFYNFFQTKTDYQQK